MPPPSLTALKPRSTPNFVICSPVKASGPENEFEPPRTISVSPTPCWAATGGALSVTARSRRSIARVIIGRLLVEGSEERTRGSEERTRGSEKPTRGSEERTRGSEERTRGSEERTRGSEERTRGAEERARGAEKASPGAGTREAGAGRAA